MATVRFISDLHLGHKRILEFCPNRGGATLEEHDQWIVDQWNSVVSKRDKVFVLGDLAWNCKSLQSLHLMTGRKCFILGNHDNLLVTEYMKYGTILRSLVRYKKMWLSHCPIHPTELRGLINVHGHVHNKPIGGRCYIHCGVDALDGKPISLDEIRDVISGKVNK